jgi:hypothetical protein
MMSEPNFIGLLVIIVHLASSAVSVGTAARSINQQPYACPNAFRDLLVQITASAAIGVAGYLMFRFGTNLVGIGGVFLMALGIRMLIAQVVEGVALPTPVVETRFYG